MIKMPVMEICSAGIGMAENMQKNKLLKLDEAVNMILDGRINANSTAHLILRAARLVE